MKRTRIKAAIIAFIGVAVLVTAIILLNNSENAAYQSKRGEMSTGFGQLQVVEWNGVKYREKPKVTTILLCGIDKPSTVSNQNGGEYRSGGQADFIMLVAIDHTDKKIYRLQIDRDTMTDIMILGVFGNEIGTRVEQICLSHSYGATPEENAKYTLQAVRSMLGGMEIDGYYMIGYDGMATLNDALGGVEVHLEFDMTSVNPAWTKGSRITLHGKEAEAFVRTRMTIGAGTNEERMVRQAEFMTKAVQKMKAKVANDLSFGEGLLTTLGAVSTSNMSNKRLVNELNESYKYETLPVDHPEGEYTIGEDGYMEFHMREDAALEWVFEHLYTRVEE